MITPDPQGWTVAVTHPDTARVKTPDVLDLQDAPALNPGPNAQPRLRLPVPKEDVWLSSAYDDDPEMRVWKDGRRLPIEVLRDVEQREDATVLVGVGGVELEARVSEEYNDDRRHIAARDLVTDNTSYEVDAPEPETATLEDTTLQTVDTEADWLAALADENEDTDLWEVSADGELRRRQTTYFEVADDDNTIRGARSVEDPDDFTRIGQDFYVFDDTVRNNVESGIQVTFDLEYEVPFDELVVACRMQFLTEDDTDPGSAWHHGFTQRIDGVDIDPVGPDIVGHDPDEPDWRTFLASDASGAPDTIGPGEVEVEVRFNADEGTTDDPDGDPQTAIDAIALYDGRHEPTLGGVTDSGRNAEIDFYNGSSVVQTSDVQSAFSIPSARLEATVNDTSGNQSVGISNDGGETWTDADNSDVVETSFEDLSSRLRARFEVGGFDGETSNAAGQVNAQAVDAYELFADITQELLLIDEVFDNDLASVLTDIGEPAERSWRFAFDGDTPTVRFVQDGQFEADFTPDFEARTREKLGKTYDSVTIKGSNERVSNEPYTADTTFTPLVRANILPGSETVYDDDENYERGDDYEIRYRDGEIRATSGGDLTEGDGYRIDYRYQAKGTFALPDAPGDPEELVETVPGVTSTRLAEQVAFVIASDVATPRYAAEVTIPDPDPRFDPVDSLPPDALGIPTGVSPLEVRGDPELTERGLRVRFGTRPALESSLQRLSRQVSRVTDRS